MFFKTLSVFLISFFLLLTLIHGAAIPTFDLSSISSTTTSASSYDSGFISKTETEIDQATKITSFALPTISDFTPIIDLTFTSSSSVAVATGSHNSSTIGIAGLSNDGGYIASCAADLTQGRCPNHTLCGNCVNQFNSLTGSYLDLDHCLANYGGNLACAPDGGYSGSCYNCHLTTTSGHIMGCNCSPGRSISLHYTEIDLNQCIGNHWGTLGCLFGLPSGQIAGVDGVATLGALGEITVEGSVVTARDEPATNLNFPVPWAERSAEKTDNLDLPVPWAARDVDGNTDNLPVPWARDVDVNTDGLPVPWARGVHVETDNMPVPWARDIDVNTDLPVPWARDINIPDPPFKNGPSELSTRDENTSLATLQDRGYAETCIANFDSDACPTGWMCGFCRKAVSNTMYATKIDLGLCVGNNNGNLECTKNGGFINRCFSCVLKGFRNAIMGCYCTHPGDQSWRDAHYTEIDLNECVSNQNTVLTCFDQNSA